MMNDRTEWRQADAAAGLCASCRYAEIVTSDRGSRFVMCARSRSDPAFSRYPTLPMRSCRGYEPVAPAPAEN